MSKTIMLVHGAWVTTDCWTSFRDFFEAKGHRVVVPEWPYLDRPVEELRRSPDPRLAKMTIKGLDGGSAQNVSRGLLALFEHGPSTWNGWSAKTGW